MRNTILLTMCSSWPQFLDTKRSFPDSLASNICIISRPQSKILWPIICISCTSLCKTRTLWSTNSTNLNLNWCFWNYWFIEYLRSFFKLFIWSSSLYGVIGLQVDSVNKLQCLLVVVFVCLCHQPGLGTMWERER